MHRSVQHAVCAFLQRVLTMRRPGATIVALLATGLLLGCGSITAVMIEPDAGGATPDGAGGLQAVGAGGAVHDGGGGGVEGATRPDAGAGGAIGGTGGMGGVVTNPCPTRFNFEGGSIYGAKLGPATMMEAFKSIVLGTEHTMCGFGALQIAAQFSGTTGNSVKGIVVIDLPAAENWAGKTLSIGVATEFQVSPSPMVTISLVTPAGYVDLPSAIRNIPATFLATTHAVPASASSVNSIVITVLGVNGYAGKLYFDEIDIR